MKHSSLQFQISKLQHAKLNTTVEAIAIVVLALFISAILPSLLVRYVYATQQLTEQPLLLEYVPVIAFVVGSGYGIYAFAINLFRTRKIAQLSKQLEEESMMLDGCCGGGCSSNSFDNEEWADAESFDELDKMVDEIIAKNESAKKEKSTSKKTDKATSKTKSKSSSKKASSKK